MSVEEIGGWFSMGEMREKCLHVIPLTRGVSHVVFGVVEVRGERVA